jgi:electron transfer flavoprotein beta subunit
MKIVVCIKRVPSTDSRIKVGETGTAIDGAQLEHIISPYDEYAVEAALQLKTEFEGSEVTVVSLDPPETTKELRTCLAMGCDNALLLKDEDASQRDASLTAQLLADAISGMGADLVLCGKQAIDRDQGQVGLILASRLGLPCATEIKKLRVADGKATVERMGNGGTTETWELPLPAVLTTTKGLNEPRYPNLKGIMAAKRKPLEQRDVDPGEARLKVNSLELPPPRREGRIIGEGPAAVDELLRLLREEAKVL